MGRRISIKLECEAMECRKCQYKKSYHGSCESFFCSMFEEYINLDKRLEKCHKAERTP